MSLLSQMAQVHSLQQRLARHYHLYQQTILPQDQDNEFLQVEANTHRSLPSGIQDSLRLAETEQEPQEEGQDGEGTEEGPQEVHLSRIFEDIVLGQEVSNGTTPFEVQLSLGESSLSIPLGRGDQFSLSNFSSFNNHQEQSLCFMDLVEKVQQATGRTLTSQGLDKLVQQIQQAKVDLEKQLQPQPAFNSLSETALRQLDRPSQPKHLFDETLNNRAFKRDSRQPLENTRTNLTTRESKGGRTARRTGEKENRERQELRISRRGRQLTLSFCEQRQFDQFCIRHKIGAAEQDRILRAIRAGKSHLVLE